MTNERDISKLAEELAMVSCRVSELFDELQSSPGVIGIIATYFAATNAIRYGIEVEEVHALVDAFYNDTEANAFFLKNERMN